MLRILDRYILRELAVSVAAVTVVILVILAGDIFARVLQQVAEGDYPTGVMFDVLGLKLLGALSGLLPMALFLGELRVIGRLHHDSEMHVLAMSGMGPSGVIRPVAMLAIGVALVTGLLSLWLRPWSEDITASLVAKANRSVIATGLEAGRFTELPGGGTIFVAGMNRRGTRLDKVFVARQYPGDNGKPPTLRVITARHGRLLTGASVGRRYLSLTNGWQYQIPLGANDWDRVHYKRNDVALAKANPGAGEVDRSSNNTLALWHSTDPHAQAKLAWRITAPVASLVLALLALPLARQAPREPRYGRLMIGVLLFFLYFNVLSLLRSLVGQGMAHAVALMWLVHAVVAGISAWFLWRQYASRAHTSPASPPAPAARLPACRR